MGFKNVLCIKFLSYFNYECNLPGNKVLAYLFVYELY